ncbi:MAG TPA: hypothetical protein VL326_00335, partial [Kofleriaceae bacterium]|nr:hypothetical protein [Kofleriaceae bacterium]
VLSRMPIASASSAASCAPPLAQTKTGLILEDNKPAPAPEPEAKAKPIELAGADPYAPDETFGAGAGAPAEPTRMRSRTPTAPGAGAPMPPRAQSMARREATEDKSVLRLPSLQQAPMKAKKRHVWAMLVAVIGLVALLALLLWWLLA